MSVNDLGAEIMRRRSKTAQVLDLFYSRPNEWLMWTLFSDLVGERAYRTRISNAHAIIKLQNLGVIESRTYQQGLHIITEYRYLPQKPLGRDAGELVPRTWNDSGPYQPPEFKLTSPE